MQIVSSVLKSVKNFLREYSALRPRSNSYRMSRQSNGDLLILKELIESKKMRPVIDRTYALSEVAQALRYLEEGHARGKVVITIEHH